MRRPPTDTLVVATHNQGKLREFKTLLAGNLPKGITRIVSAGELKLPEPDETGLSFTENALIKAQAAAKSGHLALADDSGLCVKALSGEPGIFSARWGGPEKDFKQAMKRVNDEMGAASDRAAYFVCVLALAWPDGHTQTFEGRCDGHIAWPPRGDKGHGYDPIFVPYGQMRSFAEMPEAEKNAMSHRGNAMRKLMAYIK